MKKHLKLIFSFLILLAVLLVSKIVDANSIDSISMDIYIDNSGNASVTEVWSCYTNQGTEVYHPYYNLGNSVISNLSVSSNILYSCFLFIPQKSIITLIFDKKSLFDKYTALSFSSFIII